MRNLLLVLILIPIVTYSQREKREKVEKVYYHSGTNKVQFRTIISLSKSDENMSPFRVLSKYTKKGVLEKRIVLYYDSFLDQKKDSTFPHYWWDAEVKFANSVQIIWFDTKFGKENVKSDDLKDYSEYIAEDIKPIKSFYYTNRRGWYMKKSFRGVFKGHHGLTESLNGVVSLYGTQFPFAKYEYPNSLKWRILQSETLFINNKPIILEWSKNYSGEKSFGIEVDMMKYIHPYDINPNEFDIEFMVKVFFEDIFTANKHYGSPSDLITKLEKKKSIIFNNIFGTFETLEKGTIAKSFGMDNDDKVYIKIDPEKWAKASSIKRWYILYHELGHDILNLRHGQGGKMMFNFPLTDNLTLQEFADEKEYMFKYFLKVND